MAWRFPNFSGTKMSKLLQIEDKAVIFISLKLMVLVCGHRTPLFR